MGNLFCKQTSIPATSDLSTAIDPTGTNFLQLITTEVTMYVITCEASTIQGMTPLDEIQKQKFI